jgi:hypothetical protein
MMSKATMQITMLDKVYYLDVDELISFVRADARAFAHLPFSRKNRPKNNGRPVNNQSFDYSQKIAAFLLCSLVPAGFHGNESRTRFASDLYRHECQQFCKELSQDHERPTRND